MHLFDWLVLVATLSGVVVYGWWKSRHDTQSSEDFPAGRRNLPWWTIGLGIMATQASAITFLSTPGQGYYGWDAVCAVLSWNAHCDDFPVHFCIAYLLSVTHYHRL